MERDGHIRRSGKTERDRRNGKPSRNQANKLARAQWEKSRKSSNIIFPIETCNGKKTQALKRKAVKK